MVLPASAVHADADRTESADHAEKPDTQVLVVDDHEVVRAGLTAALTRDGPMTVVGAVATGREAIDLCRDLQRRDLGPDVAVVDMRLPDMAGDELCRQMRAECPGVAVVVLSSYLDEASVRDAVRAGASAYVTKAAGLGELRAAIAEAHDSARPTDGTPSVSRIVRHLEGLVADRDGPDAPTPAQGRVLALAARGLTYSQIARDLRISESTVRFHIQRLKIKLGVRSRTELAVQAVRAGLVEDPDVEAGAGAGAEAGGGETEVGVGTGGKARR